MRKDRGISADGICDHRLRCREQRRGAGRPRNPGAAAYRGVRRCTFHSSQTLSDIDGLLNDFNREISAYLSELTFSEEEYYETEKRLDEINRLKAKYGKTMEEITAYREEQQKNWKNWKTLRAAVPHCRSSYRKRSRNWMRPHIICPKSAETMQNGSKHRLSKVCAT